MSRNETWNERMCSVHINSCESILSILRGKVSSWVCIIFISFRFFMTFLALFAIAFWFYTQLMYTLVECPILWFYHNFRIHQFVSMYSRWFLIRLCYFITLFIFSVFSLLELFRVIIFHHFECVVVR